MSRSLLDRQPGDARLVRLGRLPADCAAWRRRLASCLVGLMQVHEAAAVAVKPDPEMPTAVHAALSEAGAKADAMAAHVRAAAWGEAAGAFQAFEAHLAEAIKAAETAFARAA